MLACLPADTRNCDESKHEWNTGAAPSGEQEDETVFESPYSWESSLQPTLLSSSLQTNIDISHSRVRLSKHPDGEGEELVAVYDHLWFEITCAGDFPFSLLHFYYYQRMALPSSVHVSAAQLGCLFSVITSVDF